MENERKIYDEMKIMETCLDFFVKMKTEPSVEWNEIRLFLFLKSFVSVFIAN